MALEVKMFFDETVPNTVNYMIAGYAIIFVTLGVYLASYFIRFRNLKQDLDTLNELDKKK